jgi:hypothetical protein
MATNAPTLELEELESFQRSEWRIQRIGWVLWALAILAGLVGLLGSGPLSSTSSTAPDGSLRVQYDRFVHRQQPIKLEVTLHRLGQTGNQARLFVSQQLLERLQIQRIEPEPQGRELATDGVVYTFPTAAEAESATIRFHAKYETFGNSRGQLALLGHEPAIFDQFVYP